MNNGKIIYKENLEGASRREQHGRPNGSNRHAYNVPSDISRIYIPSSTHKTVEDRAHIRPLKSLNKFKKIEIT